MSKEEILNKIFDKFPDIFVNQHNSNEGISVNLLAQKLKQFQILDIDFPIRFVLFEKTGNLSGRNIELLKLFHQLSK